MRRFDLKNLLTLLVILSVVAGIFLRFYYGLTTDLWGDEATSFFIAKDTSWFDLIFSTGTYWDKVHPTVYYLILKFFLLFSYSDIFLRLISLFWFFPSLYLVFLISIKIGSFKNAMAALALFSLHPLLINLSFQVRSYSLTIFLILLSIYLFVNNNVSRGTNKPKLYQSIILGSTMSLSFLVNYAAIWFIASVFLVKIFMLIKNNKSLKNSIYIFLTFILIAVYQIIILFSSLFEKIIARSVIAGSVSTFNWQWFIQELNFIMGFNSKVFSLCMLFMLPYFFLKKNKDENSQLLVLLFFFSILIASIFSIFLSPIFLSRQLLVSSIASTFIISRFTSPVKGYVFLVFILLIYAYSSFNKYGFLYQQNIDKKVSQNVKSGNFVLTFEEDHDYLKYYLFANNKKSEILNIYTDMSLNKDAIDLINKSTLDVAIFTNYCPNNDYDLCRKIAKQISEQFRERIECKIVN